MVSVGRMSNSTWILRSSAELDQPIHVSGTTISSRAYLVARYVEFHKRVLVIVPNDDLASSFCSDIECFSEFLFEEPIQVTHFPTWEHSPYSSVTPSLRTRLARLTVLSQLFQGQDAKKIPEVIVTTRAALCQATLPLSQFRDSSILLQLNEGIESREKLVTRLNEAGYMRVDPVEDPGTFAVRGEIVDIFPIDRKQPIRVELFGDQIDRIREFDSATQRAVSSDAHPIQQVFIPPAREVIVHAATSQRLREALKERADDQGIPRVVRDPILSMIRDGVYPEHTDVWAPFTYSQPASLLDYLEVSQPPSIIYVDEMGCHQEWDEFLAEQKKLSLAALESEVIAPSVESLFPWTEKTDSRVQKQVRLFLDRLELITEESLQKEPTLDDTPNELIQQKHKTTIHTNSDLNKDFESKFQLWLKQKFQTILLASTQSQLERLRYLLEERNLPCKIQSKGGLSAEWISLRIGSLSEGFRWPAEKLIVLTENEILGSQPTRKQRKRATAESGSAAKNWSGLQALSDLAQGDAVVHIDHGIGLYQGLVRLDLSGAPSDFLLLEYANKDKLYLPIYRLNVIQKYVGSGGTAVLDKLGSQLFAKTKEKVKNTVKALAFDLVKLYAERKIRPGYRFSPPDTEFREFEAKFAFEETTDQLKAIDAVLADLESGQTMDRLICGDVGYGKTEVAIRAAFRAVSEGKQVAVLVPTTILAQQHEISFKARMKEYPILIESVSRFKSSKEQKKILEAVGHGKIDIIIGTHRLLSKDVQFHDLGLVIVDEEHRFGVEHKERLKTIKVNTHVLTLTATPIPRTLHLALSGLRDISLINTPPADRLPIRTYVSKSDDQLIQRAIEFELSRGGQVFFLYNRVQSIYERANRIRELVPQAKILVAHGQMPETELEKTMVDFYQKKANILLCTTIIESGLDVPSANTIIVHRADTFGLAQLYQIRGRVGRGQVRAYAYLLIPSETTLTEDAKRRLEVIQRFVELGSGFSVASHDLEIRGGGDLLGPQQSGSIGAVGFDLYTEILEEAIREIQGKPLAPEQTRREPEIKAPFPSFLPEDYVQDVHQRLSLYRRFSAAMQESEVNLLEEELRDRFGSLPLEAQNLLWLIRLKIILKRTGVDVLTVGPEKVSLQPGPDSQLDPIRAIALVSAYPHKYQLMPDSKLVARLPTSSLRDLYFGMEKLFQEFTASNRRFANNPQH